MQSCILINSILTQVLPLAGNFHVSTHSADSQPTDIDFAHVIHEVRFGAKVDNPAVPANFNPLLGRSKIDGNCKFRTQY